MPAITVLFSISFRGSRNNLAALRRCQYRATCLTFYVLRTHVQTIRRIYHVCIFQSKSEDLCGIQVCARASQRRHRVKMPPHKMRTAKVHENHDANRQDRLSKLAGAAKLEMETLRRERSVLKATLAQLSDQVRKLSSKGGPAIPVTKTQKIRGRTSWEAGAWGSHITHHHRLPSSFAEESCGPLT